MLTGVADEHQRAQMLLQTLGQAKEAHLLLAELRAAEFPEGLEERGVRDGVLERVARLRIHDAAAANDLLWHILEDDVQVEAAARPAPELTARALRSRTKLGAVRMDADD